MYLLFLPGRVIVTGSHTEPGVELTVRFCIAKTLKYPGREGGGDKFLECKAVQPPVSYWLLCVPPRLTIKSLDFAHAVYWCLT